MVREEERAADVSAEVAEEAGVGSGAERTSGAKGDASAEAGLEVAGGGDDKDGARAASGTKAEAAEWGNVVASVGKTKAEAASRGGGNTEAEEEEEGAALTAKKWLTVE